MLKKHQTLTQGQTYLKQLLLLFVSVVSVGSGLWTLDSGLRVNLFSSNRTSLRLQNLPAGDLNGKLHDPKNTDVTWDMTRLCAIHKLKKCSVNPLFWNYSHWVGTD